MTSSRHPPRHPQERPQPLSTTFQTSLRYPQQSLIKMENLKLSVTRSLTGVTATWDLWKPVWQHCKQNCIQDTWRGSAPCTIGNWHLWTNLKISPKPSQTPSTIQPKLLGFATCPTWIKIGQKSYILQFIYRIVDLTLWLIWHNTFWVYLRYIGCWIILHCDCGFAPWLLNHQDHLYSLAPTMQWWIRWRRWPWRRWWRWWCWSNLEK